MKNIKLISRVKQYVKKPKSDKFIHRLEIIFFILVLGIFALKITGYLRDSVFDPTKWPHELHSAYSATDYRISELKYFGKCPQGELKITIGQQYLCRLPTKPSIYQKIYDTYPRNPNGDEVIYPYFNSYSLTTANDFLKDQYDIPRYKPVHFKVLTWKEDPYNDRYWRFNFYSLRNTKNLLDAYTATNNPAYAQKLIVIVNGFLTVGVHQPHAWDDYHAVAWRSMTLTDIWWKLRAKNELPISTSNAILASIEQHGTFMLQSDHYEPEFNHAVNEAAALYQIGVSFPNLPNAAEWRAVGSQRLAGTLENLINANGALTENSTYYDFYVLSKYWDLASYSTKYKHPISPDFSQKLDQMVNYATYILQPNLHVPLIGASLDEKIEDTEEFEQMANKYPEFKYVLTLGKEGKKPTLNNIQFKASGQTVMRSGWTARDYTQQTQVIFNYGSYQTSHSNLAALSFQLYSGGVALLPGPGLFSYTASPLHNYFHGTGSENTVMVNGQDQEEGTGVPGKFINKNGYVSQSAADQLNPNVTQERQVVLIGSKTLLVIDKLHSFNTNNYQQLFHIFPGAKLSYNGTSVTAQGKESQQRLTITPVITKGVKLVVTYNHSKGASPSGLCSDAYGQLLPCYQLSYNQNASNATYVTVLQMGKPDKTLTYKLINNQSELVLNEAGKKYTFNIQETKGQNLSARATDTKAPTPKETVVDSMNDASNWVTSGGTLTETKNSYQPDSTSLQLMNALGKTATMTEKVSLNLSDKNILFRMNVPNTTDIDDLNIIFYSKNASYADDRLKDSYDDIHDNDQDTSLNASGITSNNGWATISLSPGMYRTQQGQWSIYGTGFNWDDITSVAFNLSSNDAKPVSVLLGQLSTFPAQSEGKVAIIFDDGSSSITPAVTDMQKYGYKGSVAVIGKYPGTSESGYLSISDLRSLKSAGWSLINHSYYHQDAVTEYYDQDNLDGLQTDVLKGAEFLQQNGLDTDDNWYIYPHGATNPEIEKLIGQYYKFARTELTAPETFPFGNPLAVKDFVVEDNTTPQAVDAAVKDANSYHQTLLLTFHRIYADSSDQSGYSINNFASILKYLNSTHTKVMSLNELDKSNGVSPNKLIITPQIPSQLDATITVQGPSILHRLRSIF